MNADVSGIILAGGQSRRMGQDKALLRRDGVCLLEMVALRLAPIVAEVVAVGPPRSELGADIRFVPDDYPGDGPLGGLISGMRRVQSRAALAVGCDMPRLSLQVLRGLVDLWSDGDDAVIPRFKGVAQPLHALYAVTALPNLEGCFDRGTRSLQHAAKQLNIRWVEISNAKDVSSFTSIDTPEDWARFEEARGWPAATNADILHA